MRSLRIAFIISSIITDIIVVQSVPNKTHDGKEQEPLFQARCVLVVRKCLGKAAMRVASEALFETSAPAT